LDALNAGYQVYKLKGDYKNALNYYEKLFHISDSLNAKNLQENKAKFSLIIESINSKKTIADMQNEELLNELKHKNVLRKKDLIRNLSMGSAIVILLLATGIWSRMRFIRKSNAQLEIAKNVAEEERNRAERSEKFKQRFLANMSHEIRTPMNAVLGMTSLTLDTELNDKQKKYLSAVKKSSENLLVIINDILDLSKMEAGKMELEKIPFVLQEQLDVVYDTLRFKAEEKGLNYKVKVGKNVPEIIIGDPSRLNQILINLCGNSIKFTEKGSVTIEVELVNTSEATLRFSVKDTGIGIPKDKAKQLFSAFQQVNVSTSRKYGGTGLGLSISKTLVELQKGHIGIESEEGKGSEFFFDIPYSIASKEDIELMQSEKDIDASSLEGIKILVAEDNEFNQIVINDTIEHLIKGVTIDIAVNGKLALEKLEKNTYDIVLMDVNMPEMDGLETTKYIREKLESPKKDIPILALTASVLSEDIKRCMDSGMNDYIPKPFKREELLGALGKYYKNSGLT